MTVLAWPALSAQPAQVQWGLSAITQVHVSPLSGAVQTQELPGAFWTTRILLRLQAADARLMQAWLARLGGRAGRAALWNMTAPTPSGVGGGAPVVNGAGQTGSALAVSGAPSSIAGWLRAGDFIGVDGFLHMVTADADTDGAGAVSLSISPPLRRSPANGAALTLNKPTATFMLLDDRQSWQRNPGTPVYELTLDFREVW